MVVGLVAWMSWGCSPNFSSGSDDAPSTATEPAYCSTVQTYASGTTVTGTALFYFRPLEFNTAQTRALGLSGTPQSQGIPSAEIIVYNAAGAVVQCGVTATNGAISVVVPGPGNYRLAVFSRSYNNTLRSSVLNNPTDNLPYGIAKEFVVAAGETTTSIGTLSAKARLSESSSLEGGAFNIHYNLFRANEFIRANGGNASFVASKVQVYWKPGFNPQSYNGGGPGASFYRSGVKQLFILGGSDGNVSSEDTDHFDDYIILHEYGHFLEDIHGGSDSPGGRHNGNAILDPRLAWSEGFANFFSASVIAHDDATHAGLYGDTYGFLTDAQEAGGQGGLIYSYNLTDNGLTAMFDSTQGASQADNPANVGEGPFRELSVSRTLFKGTYGGSCGASADCGTVFFPFSAMWGNFTDTNKFGSANVHFKNLGLFAQLLLQDYSATNATAATNFTTKTLDNERQNANTKDYANPAVIQAAACTASVTMHPKSEQQGVSNQFFSNDFYDFTHDGSQTQIILDYTQGAAQTADLDLILWREEYTYFEEATEVQGYANTQYVARSKRRYGVLENGQEVISLVGIPAGHYMLNVKANGYADALTTAVVTYTMKTTNGSTEKSLCPQY